MPPPPSGHSLCLLHSHPLLASLLRSLFEIHGVRHGSCFPTTPPLLPSMGVPPQGSTLLFPNHSSSHTTHDFKVSFHAVLRIVLHSSLLVHDLLTMKAYHRSVSFVSHYYTAMVSMWEDLSPRASDARSWFHGASPMWCPPHTRVNLYKSTFSSVV
jgi:hypothetical protein